MRPVPSSGTEEGRCGRAGSRLSSLHSSLTSVTCWLCLTLDMLFDFSLFQEMIIIMTSKGFCEDQIK